MLPTRKPDKLYVVVLDTLDPAQKAVQGMHALAELLACDDP